MASKPNDDFAAMVAGNVWHRREELDAVVSKIKELSREPEWTEGGEDYAEGSNRWSWARNTRCKYIELRIDMRDGGFILLDNSGNRINLEQLEWQHAK